MNRLPRRPRWWVLYLVLFGFVALLALESQVRVPSVDNQILLIIVVLAVYVALMIWIFANAQAVQEEEDLRHDANVRGCQMPMTERQANYRLALIRHNAQSQSQDGDDHLDPRWISRY